MDWPLVRLDSLYNIARGGSPRPIKKFLTDDPDGINWVKISDATASGKYIYKTKEKITRDGIARSRLVNKGDFILSNSMSFGRPYIMATEGCIHDGWLVLSPMGDDIDQDFLYYLLGSPFVFKQFDSLASGSTVRNLNIDLVSGVKIPLLPLEVQKRIVAILDEAFAGIDQAIANTEKNLASARELFESYLNTIFTQKGEGWVEERLGDISAINYGYTAKASGEEIGPKFLRITDIQDGGVNWETVPFCAISEEDHAKHKLLEGDLVFARTGATTGKSYLLQNPPDVVCASYLIRVRVNEGMFNPDFLQLYFQTKKYWDEIASGISGSAQGGFNASKLGALVIPVPPINEQIEISKKASELYSEIKTLESISQQKLTALNELKQSLLQKAFSGELTADMADEAQAEAAA